MKKSKLSPRCGILAAGQWIVEHASLIVSYPPRGQGADIHRQCTVASGSSFNLLANLARWKAPFPLAGAGLLGRDAAGRLILDDCKRLRIDARWLGSTTLAPTASTAVMIEQGTGVRTSFHQRGANALWDGAGLNFTRSKARIFHLGSLLRLDALDAPQARFGAKSAALLHAAQQAGLKTSVAAVNEPGDRAARSILSALKFADYCILDEIEAGRAASFKIREANGRINPVSLRHAAGALLQAGVRELVILHFPEGGFIRQRKGGDVWQSSLNLPSPRITGAGGAGDAFAAAVLLGLHEGWDLPRCLLTAVCAAGAARMEPVGWTGVKSLPAALGLSRKFGHLPENGEL
jgi:sugar/nucleoside kinase (ribokinase family)